MAQVTSICRATKTKHPYQGMFQMVSVQHSFKNLFSKFLTNYLTGNTQVNTIKDYYCLGVSSAEC